MSPLESVLFRDLPRSRLPVHVDLQQQQQLREGVYMALQSAKADTTEAHRESYSVARFS